MATIDFTPSSGVVFGAEGGFELGMEIFTDKTGEATSATRTIDIPGQAKTLQIFCGSAAMRPRLPEFHEGVEHAYVADGLFRVWLNTPTGNRTMIVNLILKTTTEPKVVGVSAFTVALTPPPPGDRFLSLTVEFESAGASGPINMEFQLCGAWSWS